MRTLLLAVFAASALTACASRSAEADNSGAGRIDRCANRLLTNAPPEAASADDLRAHARDAYCERFERNGWIYDDGALKIAAHTWLEQSGTCMTANEGEPATTVPCEQERNVPGANLECALLRHVRRSEVRDYLERLKRERERPVECDHGTPLHELGVP